MNKPTLSMTFVLGLPGAGKTEFIQKLRKGAVPPSVCFDGGQPCQDVQLICFDSVRLAHGHVYFGPLEPVVNAFAVQLATVALTEGRSVLVDESITTQPPVELLCGVAQQFGADVRMYVLDTPVEVCFDRRVKHGFPHADFERKWLEWESNKHDILDYANQVRIVHAERIARED